MDNLAGQTVTIHERVLHVDDEPMICDVTRLCLERGGRFKVDVVHSAEEALALLKQGPYSCIISDYEMPSMNGLEFLREVRTFDTEIPFILFSGRGRETVVIEAINTGADFYIQKGGDAKSLFAELNHKVDYAINKRNARLALKRRDAILEAVSLVATLFLGGESFKKALKESLTLFGLATEVDMVLVFRQDTKTEQDHIYHRLCGWSRLGDPEPAEGLLLSPLRDSFWEERILQGAPVVGSSGIFTDISPEFIQAEGIRSIAAFPIIADREVRGMIWFCDCITERQWAVVEVDALQAASAIVGSAIHQEEMRSELLAGKENYESMYSMMRQLCDTVPDMLWAKDLQGRYIFVNKETSLKLLGAPDMKDPIGRTEDHYLKRNSLSDSGSGLDESDSSLLEPPELTPGKVNTSITEESRLVNGDQIYYDIRTVPFYDQKGELIGTVAVGRDITSEKETAVTLRLERQKYARIFNHIHLGLVICGPDGKIHEFNRRAAELLGKGCEEMRGMDLHEIPGLGDTSLLRDFSTAQAIKGPIHGRYEHHSEKGTSRVLHYGIQPRYDEKSKVIEVFLTMDEHYHD